MRLEDIRFVHQRVLTIVVDVAVLLEQSEHHNETWLGSAQARAAITNAALFLECVANSCLFSLALPGRLLDELDRLPALGKLDYYLFARKGTHIDRGCRETELAADVLRLRDYIAHPRPRPGTLSGPPEEQFVDYGATKALTLALDNREWDHHDGAKVALAVVQFLRRFFLEWCGHSSGQVTGLLVFHEQDLVQKEIAGWVTMCPMELELIEKWVPELLEFMDLRPGGRDA